MRSSPKRNYDASDLNKTIPNPSYFSFWKTRLHLEKNIPLLNPITCSSSLTSCLHSLPQWPARGVLWLRRTSCGVHESSLSLSLRRSTQRLPSFEKLIQASVRSQGSSLLLRWFPLGAQTPLYQLSIIDTSLVCSLISPTVNLALKGINPTWLQLKDGGQLVGVLAAPETWSTHSEMTGCVRRAWMFNSLLVVRLSVCVCVCALPPVLWRWRVADRRADVCGDHTQSEEPASTGPG